MVYSLRPQCCDDGNKTPIEIWKKLKQLEAEQQTTKLPLGERETQRRNKNSWI